MSLELSPFLLDWDGGIESNELGAPKSVRACLDREPGSQDRSSNQKRASERGQLAQRGLHRGSGHAAPTRCREGFRGCPSSPATVTRTTRATCALAPCSPCSGHRRRWHTG